MRMTGTLCCPVEVSVLEIGLRGPISSFCICRDLNSLARWLVAVVLRLVSLTSVDTFEVVRWMDVVCVILVQNGSAVLSSMTLIVRSLFSCSVCVVLPWMNFILLTVRWMWCSAVGEIWLGWPRMPEMASRSMFVCVVMLWMAVPCLVGMCYLGLGIRSIPSVLGLDLEMVNVLRYCDRLNARAMSLLASTWLALTLWRMVGHACFERRELWTASLPLLLTTP